MSIQVPSVSHSCKVSREQQGKAHEEEEFIMTSLAFNSFHFAVCLQIWLLHSGLCVSVAWHHQPAWGRPALAIDNPTGTPKPRPAIFSNAQDVAQASVTPHFQPPLLRLRGSFNAKRCALRTLVVSRI